MSESAQIESSFMTALRAVLAVAAGLILWMIGFLALARVLVSLWPDYAIPARLWTRSGTYAFTTTMSVFNASFWILSEIAAGWLAAVIARRAEAVWTLAVLVMGYLCFMHLYYAWHALPWWYNLIVAFSSGPAVLLGGKLGSHPNRTAAAPRQAAS